jgi:hypothetical protein
VDIFEPRRLVRDSRSNIRATVPETRYRRSAAGIDVPPAVGVDQVNAFTADSDRRARQRRTVKDVLSPHCAGAWSLRLFPVNPSPIADFA